MGGMIGRMFREFAITIGAAVLVSGFVSLTLTPMLASRFLKDQHKIHHGVMYRFTESIFNGMLWVYDRSLSAALKHWLLTLSTAVVVLVGTVYLFTIIPKGFIPSEDRSQLMVSTEAAQDVSFNYMVAHQQAVADVIAADPNVDRFMSSVGGGNRGRMFVVLKPRDQRALTADQVIEELRPKVSAVPGMRVSMQNPLTIPTGGRQASSLYQVTLQGTDIAELYDYAAEFESKLRQLPDIQDVNTDLQIKNPQLNLEIDRDQAFTLGVTPAQIETALGSAYGTQQISTIYTPDNEYQVILGVAAKYQTDPSMLSMLHIRSNSGQAVNLNALAGQYENVGPMTINHTGQLPSVTVSFNLKPGVSLGPAMDQVSQVARSSMPDGMTFTFQGAAQTFQDSFSSMGWMLLLAVIVIYVVLGILYESFIHPLTILSALPFAGFGALLTLHLFGAELGIYAMVGIIMLVGLVKKNGIMMIDFALEAQRKEGKSARDAIHEACMVRFRPIMMTTMAALMAGIPIAVGYGAGGESRRPLGLAVVGGLIFSQSLTLFVTPVFFFCMDWIARLFHRKAVVPPPLPVLE
jgi:HAE1 family hydrophobic/amphiphilic exporter-1